MVCELGIYFFSFGIFLNRFSFKVPYHAFNIKLQRMFSLIAVAFLVWNILQMFLWMERSKTGSKGPLYLLLLSGLMTCIAAGTLFWCLLLATKGMGIVRESMDRRETLKTVATVLLLMVSTGVYEGVGKLGLILLAPVYLFIARVMFASSMANLDLLTQQLVITKEAEIRALSLNIKTKIRVFEVLQFTLVGLIVVESLVQLCVLIFWNSWISSVINHAAILIAVSSVCFGLRMRPFYPTVYHVNNEEELPDADEKEEAPLVARPVNIALWRPGKPYPKGALDSDLAWMKCYETPRFLIHAPSEKSGGTMVAACCLTGKRGATHQCCNSSS